MPSYKEATRMLSGHTWVARQPTDSTSSNLRITLKKSGKYGSHLYFHAYFRPCLLRDAGLHIASG